MTCTQRQLELLFKYSTTYTQEVAAAKAGMSLSTAKRYLKTGGKKKVRLPEKRTWRTREDPFAEVWDQLKGMLQNDHGLEAQTLMDWLMESYPGKFEQGQVRTLRRRVHDWRVLEGPERKEVMFAQNIQPGMQSQSDYTHCDELEITIDGEVFPHMLFHFMLPYSRWEFVWICFSESFESLTQGYSMAVKSLGAVAVEHRTDNLAAAVPIGEHGSFQIRWSDFLSYYYVKPSTNTPGCSNQNGSVEKSHHLFKHAIDQRLRLRGSREFQSVAEYDSYIQKAAAERNKLRHQRVQEELKLLQTLPPEHWYDPKQYSVTVTAWSTVSIAGATYSVPSRFIGQRLKALANDATVNIYYGKHLVLSAPKSAAGERLINYRHLIFHLLRKPGAFRNYQYREELFPLTIFRDAYDRLLVQNEEKADKEYLRILNSAAMEGEELVSKILVQLLNSGEPLRSDAVHELCTQRKPAPDVVVAKPVLSTYDALLKKQDRRD